MKKFLVLFLLFIPIIVKAELTKKQQDDLAFYTNYFISEASKRVDSNNYGLLAYMDGTARISGFQGKLYKMSYDYSKKYAVNNYKWTFDDSSFVAFIYSKVFNLVLTNTNTSKIDEYSGLNIKSEAANPYTLDDFLEDATKEEHFYIYNDNYDLLSSSDSLEIGDLLVINNHIALYIGDEKIAHASSYAINGSNLGIEIVALKERYASFAKVLRLKDKIVNPKQEMNTLITWIDTNETIDIKDPDKKDQAPKISYVIKNENWTKAVNVSISFSALNGLKAYSLSNGEDTWEEITGNTYTLEKEVTENGEYYLKLKDQKDIISTGTFKISNIDVKDPVVEKLSATSREKYSIIEIVAVDQESGLADDAYSFDNGKTWSHKNTYEVQEEKEYTILVRDKLDNISESKLYVYVSEEANPTINNIIYGEYNENKEKVVITTLNCNHCSIGITTGKTKDDVDKWEEVSDNTYTDYFEKGTYNVFLKNANDEIVASKKIKVNSNEENKKIRKIIISIILQIISFTMILILIVNRRINKI